MANRPAQALNARTAALATPNIAQALARATAVLRSGFRQLTPGRGTLGLRASEIANSSHSSSSLSCPSAYVVDRDTLRCGPARLRLLGIDAPELPGTVPPIANARPGIAMPPSAAWSTRCTMALSPTASSQPIASGDTSSKRGLVT